MFRPDATKASSSWKDVGSPAGQPKILQPKTSGAISRLEFPSLRLFTGWLLCVRPPMVVERLAGPQLGRPYLPNRGFCLRRVQALDSSRGHLLARLRLPVPHRRLFPARDQDDLHRLRERFRGSRDFAADLSRVGLGFLAGMVRVEAGKPDAWVYLAAVYLSLPPRQHQPYLFQPAVSRDVRR